MHNEKNQVLINAAQSGEIRVALLEDGRLSDLDIEYTGCEQKKSNIYKGKISRLEPGLEAAFVSYGAERDGFLPFREMVPPYFLGRTRGAGLQDFKSSPKVGQEVMVQVKTEERLKRLKRKEESKGKGAALATYSIALPGIYLVLMPNKPGAGGVSRRIEGNERRAMQDLLSQIEVPASMSLILRTAGEGRSLEELLRDRNFLLEQWDAIQKAFRACSVPALIFKEGDLVTRSIRGYLRRDIDDIIIDDSEVYEKIKRYVEQIRPDFVSRITLYQNSTPLFLHFNVEEAAESAFQREKRLPSGGTVVVERTEALVAIDVNSGRSTKNGDIEETATKTNLEAAEAIPWILRVGDYYGLIVIDFIGMNSEDNKRKVENCLREASKKDRARIQMERISPLGLVVMSRQRLGHSLGRANETLCQHCDGQGTIRSIESLAFSLLRLIEKEALKKSTQGVRVEVSVAMATYLINEKRSAINQIEQRYKISLSLIPNPYWQPFKSKITAIARNASAERENVSASYDLIEERSNLDMPYTATTTCAVEEPPVKSGVLSSSKNKPKTQLGILSRLFSMLTDFTKPKTAIPIINQTDQKNQATSSRTMEDYATRSYPERRYSKINKESRARPKRERGQQNHRYSSGTALHHERARTKPFPADRELPQVKKKLLENSNVQGLPNKIVREQDPNPKPVDPKPVDLIAKPVIPLTSGNTSSSVRLQKRKNTRRYGGEPKLRHRGYIHDTHGIEKK